VDLYSAYRSRKTSSALVTLAKAKKPAIMDQCCLSCSVSDACGIFYSFDVWQLSVVCVVCLSRKKMLFFVQPHVSQMPVVSGLSSTAAAADANDIHYTRNRSIDRQDDRTNNWWLGCWYCSTRLNDSCQHLTSVTVWSRFDRVTTSSSCWHTPCLSLLLLLPV